MQKLSLIFKMLGCENGEVANLAMKEDRIIITLDLTFTYSFYFMNRGKSWYSAFKVRRFECRKGCEFSKKEKKKVEKSLVIVEEEGYRIIE
jgi:hypothetical protein